MSLFNVFKNKNPESDAKKEDSNLNKEQEKQRALEVLHQLQKDTKVPCAKLKLIDEKPDIYQSKVGGLGYIPHDGDFPVNSNGRQLRLLAQIDCSEVSLDQFPKQGLLQFWILNDDVFGMDFGDSTKQDTFRIIYHMEIDRSVTEDEVKSKFRENEFDNDNMMPNNGEYKIKFNIEEDLLSMWDCSFDTKFAEKYNQLFPDNHIESFSDIDVDVDETEEESGFGHKIGGYPAFTQYDPREEDSPYDFLLLQLDSDYKDENTRIMWGDSGIGNFFINSEKLKNLDFSDVLYNWDCC